MAALRGVAPRNPWLAGSSWSYASTSTMAPPTPSTRSVTPIRSGATSCTERAKKSRRNRVTVPRVAAEKRGECERDDETLGDCWRPRASPPDEPRRQRVLCAGAEREGRHTDER